MSPAAPRYALYFAPDRGTALARFGRRWLGYDAATGELQPQPDVPGLSPERLAEVTEDARHYGFHATLKPPFVLTEGRTERELMRSAADFAAAQQAFTAPPLKLARISGFIALTLSEHSRAMEDLAAAAVESLDDYRAPASDAELARRRRARLSSRQEELLSRWGYPYVMEEFRFHMTLTARLDGVEGSLVESALRDLVAPLCVEPLKIETLCVFQQPRRTERFRIIGRYKLAAMPANLSAINGDGR